MMPAARIRPRFAFAFAFAALAACAAPARGQETVRRSAPPPPELTLAADPATAPLTFVGKRPVVAVTLDGKGPFPFVLDTGTSGTVVASSLAQAQGIPVVGKARVASPGSPDPMEAVLLRVGTLGFAGATAAGLTAVSVDLSGPFPGPADPVGVLSTSMFAGYLLTIDYPAARLVLSSGALPAADGREVLEYDAGRRVPGVTLVVGGRTVDLDVDTGSPWGITLPAGEAARLKLDGPLVDARPDRRMDRVLPAKEGRVLGETRIGRFELPEPTVRFVDGIRQGVVGSDVLRRFALTLDAKNHRLRLAVPAGEPAH